METFLEHLAFSSGQDPLEFRLNNLLAAGDSLMTGDPFVGPNLIPEIVKDLKVSSDYEARKIQVKEFNVVCFIKCLYFNFFSVLTYKICNIFDGAVSIYG